jgi:tripartite motif-containing protein 71
MVEAVMLAKRFLLVSTGLVCLSQFPSTASAQTFITAWGGYGTGVGQFRTPYGVAVGGSGDVYVVDNDNRRVSVFTRSGSYLRQWSLPENANSASIAVDADDNVFVSDATIGGIYKFTSTGTLVTQWGGASGGLAVDGSGNVYVGSGERIVVFTGSGAHIREWGTYPPTFGGGVAVDNAGNLYVGCLGYVLRKYTNTGTLIGEWGSGGTGDGQFGDALGGVALGAQGQVYVVDNANARVQVFTSDGAFVAKWGSYGTITGRFDNPFGIAVDAYGDIYVADKNNSRIEKFGYAPTSTKSESWGRIKALYR